ncbi:FxDxF family PEP-CTERM protein [Aquabacterium sp.]|uniref:FxDxF family PEP-CTERM protein n=1 Tax=Aquabacterium sp. TaxID=1872578 RepID=UPI0025C068E3|nr:FxDxF family PEP-CTERM protein [Aquabacterium sp.]
MNSLKSAFLAVLVSATGMAGAVTTNLGLLSAGDTSFGNTFYSSGTFTDYYTFSIGANSSGAAGTLTDSDLSFFTRDVDVTKIVLSGGTLASAMSDGNADDGFSFTGLGAGAYTMALSVNVGSGFLTSGNYKGTIHAVLNATPTAPVASPAPEPADFAMALMGLAGVGYMVRRRSAR